MDAQDGSRPDASPPKPVSSLRSRFENISSSTQTPNAVPPDRKPSASKTTDPLDAIRASAALKKPPPAPPSLPKSLDAASRPNVQPGSNGTYKAEAARPETPVNASRSRPQSVVVQSPPHLSITEPTSPPKHIQIPPPDPLQSVSSQGQSPRTPRGEPPPLPTPRHLRFTSRSVSRSSEALNQASPAARSEAPAGQQPAETVSSPRAVKPPPPVNRAAKPSHVKLDHPTRPSTTPPLLQSPTQDRGLTSPFGSSPEEGDDSDPIAPPPVPLTSKPNQTLSRKNTFDDFLPQSSLAPVSIAAHPPRISSHTRNVPSRGHGRRRSRSAIEDSTDSPEARPRLPPRSTEPEPLIRNHAKNARSIGSRRSIDATQRPSALTQGFAKDTPGALRKASLPSLGLPGSQPSTPIRSASRTPPPRPSGDIPRSFKSDTRVRAKDPPEPEPADDPTPVPLVAEFPDSSAANRRAPHFRKGPRMIATTYNSRLFDISGEYVCTSGTHTRVWSLLTGRLMLTMAHGEEVKALALAFKPTRNIEEEGKKIWIGNNFGELQEVDVTTKRTVAFNDTVHARREVVKIFRNGTDMWSLDNEGKIVVWPAGLDGTPSLSRGVVNGRVPQGHTASVVADGKLWLASGRGLHVFQPSADPQSIPFKITSHALLVQGAGDIISSAALEVESDKIFFGHTDGKISVFSRKTVKHMDTFSINLFKINCLVGVGSQLWAGFNTGTIVIFDTSTRPWKTKKYWTTHSQSIVSIVSDRDSLWKQGRWHVVSLGQDNHLGVWDGMLEDDWLENQMRLDEPNYSSYEEVDAGVFTWNAGASKPSDLRYDRAGDSNFFRDFLKGGDLPDIMVFGLQELVDLEDKKLTAKSFFKSKKQDPYGQEQLATVYRAWRDYLARCLDEYLPDDGGYSEIHTSSLVGLFTCIFVKASVRHHIRDIQAAQVKTGMGGLHGNKGALIVRFMYADSSMCFTNCHLAAGQTSTQQRNNDVASILGGNHLPLGKKGDFTAYVGGGDGTMIMDHEICIFNGDLNYRIDTMSRETVVNAIKSRNLGKLLDRDQLLLSRRKNPAFRLRDFTEQPIKFEPTYKYDVGTDNYDTSEKRRSPAWCDRILYRGPETVKQLSYKRHEIRMSDHRPVTGSFKLRVKTVNDERREQTRQRSDEKFLEYKHAVADDAKLDYLVTVFGLSKDEARRKLVQ